MQLTIHVTPEGTSGPAPAEGTTVQVEVRDTSLADAPATTLATAEGTTTGGTDWSAAVEVEVPDALQGFDSVTVWARVSVDGSATTSVGDWITMQSYPLDPSAGSSTVRVRQVS